MARYSIEDVTLTAIGDAIRQKNGKLTETKTGLASQIIFKSDTAVDMNTFNNVDQNNLGMFAGGQAFVNEVITIPGAAKYVVKANAQYGFNIAILPYEYTANEKPADGSITAWPMTNEYEATTITICWERKNYYMYGNYVYGFYFEVIAYDASGKPIVLDTDDPKVECSYTGLYTMTPGEMPEEILDIKPTIQELTITSNGTYDIYEGVDGFAPVVVKVFDENQVNAADLTFTDRCSYLFNEGNWDWVINKYGNLITTQDITKANYMFSSTKVNKIPFAINFKQSEITNKDLSFMFNATSLTEIPTMNMGYAPYNMTNMFSMSSMIEYFPEGFAEDWDYSSWENATSNYVGSINSAFSEMYRLRALPQALISHSNPKLSNSSSLYYYLARRCYSLEKVNDLYVYNQANWTGNAFYYAFQNCSRLKEITFAKQANGQPYVCNGWKNQIIDLSTTGYGNAKAYNPVFTDDTKVDGDLDKYLAYVNETGNPDGWASAVAYSVFNRKSMVKLIDSLPDVSGSSGTNTIKYNWGQGGGYGDEYAMSKLSEAEIAVAAAKGWTVATV